MIDGIEISMGGKKYLVPPLSLKWLKTNSERMKSYAGVSMDNPQSVDLAIDIVLGAIKRNYPEITGDDLLDMIDMGNVTSIMEVIMGISGLKRVSGESWTGSGAVQSAGETSTD